MSWLGNGEIGAMLLFFMLFKKAILCDLYYRKRRSASYIVHAWLLWVVVERERERDACDVIDITLKSWVIMHMITSTARIDPTRRRVLSLYMSSARSACKDKELRAWALDRAAGSSDWWMMMGKWKLCVRWSDYRGSPSSISLACFKQEELTKLMFIYFSNGPLFCLWEQIGYPFASVPARCRNTTLLQTW